MTQAIAHKRLSVRRKTSVLKSGGWREGRVIGRHLLLPVCSSSLLFPCDLFSVPSISCPFPHIILLYPLSHLSWFFIPLCSLLPLLKLSISFLLLFSFFTFPLLLHTFSPPRHTGSKNCNTVIHGGENDNEIVYRNLAQDFARAINSEYVISALSCNCNSRKILQESFPNCKSATLSKALC